MNDLFAALIALLAVVLIVYRQLQERTVNIGWLVILPGVLLFFALSGLSRTSWTAGTLTQLVLSVLVGIVLGYLACLSLKITDRGGEAVVKGTWAYLGWFLAAMLARLVIAGTVAALFHTKAVSSSSWVILLLSVAAFLGVRSVYVYSKARQMGLTLARRRR